MHKILFPLLILLSLTTRAASPTFRSPLDIPLFLSGTFGELRSNHFHSGVDFKTQSTEGHPIFAVEEGYISRIKVEPGGYGHALYIDHPNGYTSVYCHLQRFSDSIAAYVLQQQYAQKSFAVDLFPAKTQFPLQKGDQIALSGDTGSSQGPHLHFEIRKTSNQHTTNALQYGFSVQDHIPPTIRQVSLYPMQSENQLNPGTATRFFQVTKNAEGYTLTGTPIVEITGKFAVGIETIDLLDGATNNNGIYSILLTVDSVPYYQLIVDEYAFEDTRYINSLIDYATYYDTQKRLYKLYVAPNNRLTLIKSQKNRGVISFDEAGLHQIRMDVGDINGNFSSVRFNVQYTPFYQAAISDSLAEILQPSTYKQEQKLTAPGLEVTIPANALYEDVAISCIIQERQQNMYGPAYCIHNPRTPLHKPIKISIAADSIPEHLRSKALLVSFDIHDQPFAVGGTYQNGKVSGSSSVFGKYTLGIDTVPPTITPVNAITQIDYSGRPNLKIRIRDDFSGISSYEGRIDGQWVCFVYDSKNALLTYTFDRYFPKGNRQHELILKVKDSMGNETVYQTTFLR